MIGIYFFGYKIGSDCIGVDMIVNLRQLSFGTPSNGFLFFLFQSLELLDDKNLELRTNPHGKLKGNILVSIGAAVTSCFGLQADGIGASDKLLDTYLKTVQTGLVSNYGEFAIIKIWVVYFLPNADVLQRIAVAQPVGDKEITVTNYFWNKYITLTQVPP